MTLGARLIGVIRRPRATFEAVAAGPRWAGLMAGSAAATALAGALLFQTEVGRLALVDQWERTAIAFGQSIDDTRYEELQQFSEQGAIYSVGRAVLSGPVLIVSISLLLFALLNNRPSRAQFRGMLAIVTHASVILTIRQLVAAPIAYARETTASTTSLGVWFPMFDEGSAIARFLGALDLFVIWWAVVLAIGAGVLYRRKTTPLALSFVGTYVGIAVVVAVAMALMGGTT